MIEGYRWYYGSQKKEEVDQTGVSRNFSKEVKFDL